MRISSLAISVLLHVACVATAIVVSAPPRVDPDPDEREEITFIEILDESSASEPTEASLPDEPPSPVKIEPPPHEPPPLPEPPPPPEPTPSVAVSESSSPAEPSEPRVSSDSESSLPEIPPRPVVPSVSSGSHFAKCEPSEGSQVVSLPAAVNRIAPKYPRSARRKGHEGRVLVEAEIGVSGEVLRAEVLDSSGYQELDDAAIDAVRRAEFVSAKDGDTPITGVIRLPIEFRLNNH